MRSLRPTENSSPPCKVRASPPFLPGRACLPRSYAVVLIPACACRKELRFYCASFAVANREEPQAHAHITGLCLFVVNSRSGAPPDCMLSNPGAGGVVATLACTESHGCGISTMIRLATKQGESAGGRCIQERCCSTSKFLYSK